MSDALVRAAVVATLAAVPGIGVVHDRERFAADQKKLRDLYTIDDKLLGWFVSRNARREVSAFVGRNTVVSHWRVQGFMAMDDANSSETALATLIDAACDAFRADETLGGTVFEISDATLGEPSKPVGLQLEKTEPVMFCGVLCHGARLALTTSHQLSY